MNIERYLPFFLYKIVFFTILALFLFAHNTVHACSKNLTFGSEGPEVLCLQKILTITGDYTHSEYSSFFGKNTEMAVKRFQTRMGIVSAGDALSTGYGHLGPQTFRTLLVETIKKLQQLIAERQSGSTSSSRSSSSSSEESTLPPEIEEVQFDYNSSNKTVDLRKYLPAKATTVVKRKSDGSVYSSYVYTPGGNSSFQSLYNNLMDIGVSGQIYTIQKRYGSISPTCTPTYAIWFLGDDKSVTEVGDWMATDKCTPNTAFGYYNADRTKPSGLIWAPSGGLRTDATPTGVGPKEALIEGLKIYSQNFSGDAYLYRNASTWNETEVVETLAEYTPPFGRGTDGAWGFGKGKTYEDVIRIRFFHGTRIDNSEHPQINCSAQIKDEGNSYSGAYKHNDNFNTYTSEFYLAPGKGVIQETLLYVEDATYWSAANCSLGIMFSNEQSFGSGWHSYIDE